MHFTIRKCKILEVGKNNQNKDDMMQGVVSERIIKEKNLEGKQTGQCQAATGKPNRAYGCIRRGINYESKEVVLTMYRNLVKPHL